MRKDLLLIINPKSGTRGKSNIETLAHRYLDGSGYETSVVWTEYAGHATELAREAKSKGFSGVLVAGGDGTVNETASGLIDSDIPFGIIPCGSGNGLARHIGLGADPDMGFKTVLQQNIIDIDFGTVNGRPFFCTFGIGFDATVSERFSHQGKRGKATYIKSALNEFLKYRPEEYTIKLADGSVINEKAFLIAVCNASQYGNNAYIAPKASITDGLLDVTVIHSGSPITTALIGVDLMTGTIDRNMLIDTFRAQSISIIHKGQNIIHIDGEPAIGEDEIHVQCCSKRLKVFAPLDDKPFKPIITPVSAMVTDINSDLKKIFRPN